MLTRSSSDATPVKPPVRSPRRETAPRPPVGWAQVPPQVLLDGALAPGTAGFLPNQWISSCSARAGRHAALQEVRERAVQVAARVAALGERVRAVRVGEVLELLAQSD